MHGLKSKWILKCCDYIKDCVNLCEPSDCKQCLEISISPLDQQIIRGSEVMSIEEFMRYGGGDTGFKDDIPQKYKVIAMKIISIYDKNIALCAMKAISLSKYKTLIITGSSLKYSTSKYCNLLKTFIRKNNGLIEVLEEMGFSDTKTEFCVAVIPK